MKDNPASSSSSSSSSISPEPASSSCLPSSPPLPSSLPASSCPNPPKRISAAINLLASGMAAIVSTVCVQPLELIKTRLQVNRVVHNKPFVGMTAHFRNLVRTEGVRGLYRGVFPSLISFVPSISIYYTLYNEFKGVVGCPSMTGNAPKVLFLQSISAGLASNCTAAITNPLWLIKTRIQAQTHTGAKYKNSFHVFQSIFKEEGVRGFYKGLTASFLASSQAMIQFPLYEGLKCILSEQTQTSSYLLSGAIASSMACTLTYPSEVVRSRLQVQGSSKSYPQYSGVFSAFKTIWREEGMRGMYRGLLPNLMRIAPAHAIALTVYEVILGFRSRLT